MPELPEVETVCRGLLKLLPGRCIEAVGILNPASFIIESGALGLSPLIGQTIVTVRRRAKLLMIDLASQHSLLIHLKMTGQLVFVDDQGRFGAGHPSDSLVDGLPDHSTRLIFRLGTARLYFNDQRKFGWVRLLKTADIPALPFFQALGPEPLADGFGPAELAERLRLHPGRIIKAALLDQSMVSGIGNIYADEALWLAAIHPETRIRELDEPALARLHQAIRDCLQSGIDHGGSTDRNYVDAEGRRGAYLDFAAVFRREGQACRRCGAILVKSRVAGRGSHWCPVCQPQPPDHQTAEELA